MGDHLRSSIAVVLVGLENHHPTPCCLHMHKMAMCLASIGIPGLFLPSSWWRNKEAWGKSVQIRIWNGLALRVFVKRYLLRCYSPDELAALASKHGPKDQVYTAVCGELVWSTTVPCNQKDPRFWLGSTCGLLRVCLHTSRCDLLNPVTIWIGNATAFSP